MRTLQNVLLLGLTMTSGTVDAVSFLKLGQVFSAAMTGNTVLFGLALVHAIHSSALRYVLALFGFVIGNGIASLACRKDRKRTGWYKVSVAALGWELLLLVVAALFVDAQVQSIDWLLIMLFSAAMGVQGVVARRVGVYGITTTVITSTLTGLIESVVWNLHGRFVRGRLASNHDVVNGPTTPISSILLWFLAIAVYGLGAAICGVAIIHAFLWAVWIPVITVLFVIVAGFLAFVRSPD